MDTVSTQMLFSNPFAMSPFQSQGRTSAIGNPNLQVENDQSAVQAGAELHGHSESMHSSNNSSGANSEDAGDRENPDSQQGAEGVSERRELEEERREISALASRDREVRAHEQAHVSAGGQYAGSAVFQFERGPDGVSYAIAGEVPISTGREATPEATLRKAQIIRRAALAPAEPSPQDRRVAAQASQMEAEARAEISQKAREEDAEASAVADAAEGKPETTDVETEAAEAVEISKAEPVKHFNIQRYVDFSRTGESASLLSIA